MAPEAVNDSGKSAPRARTFPFRSLLAVLAAVGGMAAAMPLRAQLLDSLALFAGQRPRFVAKLDSRGSFISNSNVRMFGIKVGAEHAGRFQYGLGYSFLASPVESSRTVEGQAGIPVRLHMGLLVPYVEYAFYQRRAWEIRIPVQLGLGRADLSYPDAAGGRRVLRRSFVLFYEPAMTVQYRFLRYFGASAGWGFRLQLVRTGLEETLSAPVYLVGLKVFMGDLWADLKRMEGD